MVVSRKESLEGEAGGFAGGELPAGTGPGAGPLRAILGIEGSWQRGFAVVLPLVPALGVDLRGHLGVHEDDGGVGAPGTAEIDAGGALGGGDAAAIEDVPASFFGVVPALRGDHDRRMSERVDLAAVEESQGIAEDEIHVAFDVALGEVLAGRFAGPLIALAPLAVRVQRVLIAEEADAAEDGAIAGDLESDGL